MKEKNEQEEESMMLVQFQVPKENKPEKKTATR